MEDVITILVLIGITALGIIIGHKSFLNCPVEVFLKIIRLLAFFLGVIAIIYIISLQLSKLFSVNDMLATLGIVLYSVAIICMPFMILYFVVYIIARAVKAAWKD